MNKTTEMIVFRSRKTGEFLNSYKDRSSLAFAADFCSLEYCLKLPRKKYEDNKKTYKALATAFDCEIVALEIEYKMSYPNGSEVEPIKHNLPSIEDLIEDILGGL
ncbi:phage protein [Streptococcus pneumoniae]|uniref:Phage protein n=1 Tax=Streptococcus phage phiARI0131-1 TaxID=1701813 RepID=A0A141E0U6_9CAUD|nr:hypothetical protein [Streptococcus pneumoniae]YP_009320710.1 hypothetical protein BOX02_gp43 [Streptococcus phage phiARI0131-1]ALA47355.1 hypothetical protein phiARI0131-1_40 [Streptococcus phage phiARI0131-1]WIA45152.1 hypothetical protein ODS73_08155 [Streptococcus pneumoniae]CEW26482.1 phage protein [Streptococcus pneumoniae]CEZ05718.1 phage protein [Streptococcus pneumoniae]CGE90740.1 phage protein [Streptococcus pneumoniae]